MTNTTKPHKPQVREDRRFMGGYLTLHAAGGVMAVMEELEVPNVTAVVEMLLHEALKARHPEWYDGVFKHPIEIEVETRLTERRVAELAAQLEEAKAQAQAAAEARARAA